MKPKHPAGPPMTLGNMRELGVRNLVAVTTPTAIVWSGLFVAPLGRSRLAEFRKPAAEGGMPSGALLARVGKLGSHIGKLGSERGDDQLVMIDDRLAICVRFERRIGLDGMCGGHPAGHHADRVMGPGFFVVPSGG